MTTRPPATMTSGNSVRIPRIANAVLTFCFILFALAYPFSISLTQGAAIVGTLTWLIQTQFAHSWDKVKLVLIWPVAMFFLAGVLSVITAVDPAMSVSGLKKLLKAIAFFWVVNALALIRPVDFLVYGSQRYKSPKVRIFLDKLVRSLQNTGSLNFITGLMIAAGTLSAAYGFFQGFTHSKGIWDGLLGNIMTYSVILMLIACLVLARILFDRQSSKTFLIGAFLILGGAMALTLNRQAWLGLFVTTVFLLFIKRKIFAVIPIILVGLILTVGPHTFKERLKSIVDLQQASNSQRIMLLKAGWDVFKDYPLTGCGFKCLFVVADQYPEHPILHKRHGQRQLVYRHLHNNVLQIAVDTGVIGLCAWISIWVVYFVKLTRRAREIPSQSNERWVIFGSAGAVIAFLVAGMFENSFYDSEIILAVYFIMALPFVSTQTSQSGATVSTASLTPEKTS